MKPTRQFTQDVAFPSGDVLKTSFRGDVARVFLKDADRIVVLCRGRVMPIPVDPDMPLPDILVIASDALDRIEGYMDGKLPKATIQHISIPS